MAWRGQNDFGSGLNGPNKPGPPRKKGREETGEERKQVGRSEYINPSSRQNKDRHLGHARLELPRPKTQNLRVAMIDLTLYVVRGGKRGEMEEGNPNMACANCATTNTE